MRISKVKKENKILGFVKNLPEIFSEKDCDLEQPKQLNNQVTTLSIADEIHTPMLGTAKCDFCGKEFEKKSYNQIYCSGECRIRSYEVKNNVTGDKFRKLM